jgi:hypothetical protein
LKREELRWILEESKRMPAGTPMAAYLYMVVGANEVSYKELVEMSNKFDKLMEECGLAAKWEAKGRKEEQKQAVRRMQRYGMDPVEIGKVLELPLSTVFSYLKAE